MQSYTPVLQKEASPQISDHIVPLPASADSTTRQFTTRQLSSLLDPSASPWAVSRSKRWMDLSVALLVLTVFVLPMLAIALCIRLSSRGPILFRQQRIGRGGKLFWIYKFRSMEQVNSQEAGPGLTREGDSRVTPLGRLMRKLKIDELPQFYNILRGEMSLVGPRPKLPQYEAIVNMPYRPGITGAATLAFRREEEMLGNISPSELDLYYEKKIKPLKARIDVRYMCRATLASDLRMLAATLLACLAPARVPAIARTATAARNRFPSPAMAEHRAGETYEVAG